MLQNGQIVAIFEGSITLACRDLASVGWGLVAYLIIRPHSAGKHFSGTSRQHYPGIVRLW